jgi:competence protein ComEC
MATLCAAAPVVSSRAPLTALPPACAGRLVLDGTDYARGGAVELWRSGEGWRAAWTADVRGNRPWSRIGDPDAIEIGVSDNGG